MYRVKVKGSSIEYIDNSREEKHNSSWSGDTLKNGTTGCTRRHNGRALGKAKTQSRDLKKFSGLKQERIYSDSCSHATCASEEPQGE